MAFCNYCGKQLADGEVCSCTTAAAAAPQPAAPQPAPQPVPQPTPQPAPAGAYYPPTTPAPKSSFDFGGIMKDCWNLFLNLFKKPVTAVSEFIQNGTRNHAFIMIGLQAIVVTLLLVILACQHNADLKSDWAVRLAQMAGMSSEYILEQQIATQQQYVNVFLVILVGLFGTVGLSAAFAGVKMLVAKIFKGTTSFDTELKVSAVTGFVAVPFILVGILLVLILTGENAGTYYKGVFSHIGGFGMSTRWGILVAMIGYLFGYLLMCATISEVNGFDPDKRVYAILAISIAMLLVYYLLSRLVVFPITEPKWDKLQRQASKLLY